MTTNFKPIIRNENSPNMIQNKILTEQEIQTFPTFIRDDSNKLSRPLIKSVIQQNYDPVYLKPNNYNNSMQNMTPNEFEGLKKEKSYNNTYSKVVRADDLRSQNIDNQALIKSKYFHSNL